MTRKTAHISKSLIAAALILIGLYLAAFGNAWGPIVFNYLPATELGSWLELVVPFLPMLFIGSGAALFVSPRR